MPRSRVTITKWNAKEFEFRLRGHVASGMTKAMAYAEGDAKRRASNTSPSAPGGGPGVLTGAHRASISSRVEATVNAIVGSLWGSMPYSLRLELGFTGTDSLGRSFSQAPRPHLRPAILENGRKLLSLIRGG